MSRNIDAVICDPSVVSMPRTRSKNGPLGACPSAAATALHSSSMPRIKSLPPGAARILPTEVRIRQVQAASVARNTHFSHISARHDLGDSADPVRQSAVALAEIQRLHRIELNDLALVVERDGDRAKAAEHALAPELLVEH